MNVEDFLQISVVGIVAVSGILSIKDCYVEDKKNDTVIALEQFKKAEIENQRNSGSCNEKFIPLKKEEDPRSRAKEEDFKCASPSKAILIDTAAFKGVHCKCPENYASAVSSNTVIINHIPNSSPSGSAAPISSEKAK